MIKYMFINVNWEKIKYQIGKRYNCHIQDFKCIYEYVNGFDIINHSFEKLSTPIPKLLLC